MPAYVVVSALDAGHITLPERLFVTDAEPNLRVTVPSLSFLIQHQPSSLTADKDQKTTRIVLDLGVKRDLTGYREMQLAHVAQRRPIITDPDCAESLRKGDPHSRALDGNTDQQLLDPGQDIDFVILSHVHWDHVDTPSDFKNSTFIVGSGTLDLLKNGAGPLYPAELFNQDELPRL
ncbi:Lactamase-B domain-containing protein [Fusarium sp. LHS14.1]|nr:Lactamase-B domain-containing protein [Fusarium sp. LHS14.1]